MHWEKAALVFGVVLGVAGQGCMIGRVSRPTLPSHLRSNGIVQTGMCREEKLFTEIFSVDGTAKGERWVLATVGDPDEFDVAVWMYGPGPSDEPDFIIFQVKPDVFEKYTLLEATRRWSGAPAPFRRFRSTNLPSESR